MKFTIYKGAEILRIIDAPSIDGQLQDGEEYIEGNYPDDMYYMDGEPVEKPSKPSQWHEFDYDLKSWVDTKPEGYDEALVRAERNRLLSATDWSQLPDVADEISLKYQAYRQELRDLPEQDGFPNVTFPTKPE